jgi:hypothetical protein
MIHKGNMTKGIKPDAASMTLAGNETKRPKPNAPGARSPQRRRLNRSHGWPQKQGCTMLAARHGLYHYELGQVLLQSFEDGDAAST